LSSLPPAGEGKIRRERKREIGKARRYGKRERERPRRASEREKKIRIPLAMENPEFSSKREKGKPAARNSIRTAALFA
jgi:hypothetical protein